LLTSCFWLLVPLLLVDVQFADRLPAMYQPQGSWNDVAPVLSYGENILRALVVTIPLLIPLSLSDRRSWFGLAFYLAGSSAYVACGFALIVWPDSGWSTSAGGLLAPAYTPLVWAAGIGLIGRPRHVAAAFGRWLYPVVVVGFTAFHLTHALIAYGHISP
jgi:hypothetical protein